MKKFLRLLALALCICLMASLFAGCGKEVSKDDVTTISIWTNYASNKKIYTELINKYNEGQGKEDGIFIEYTVKEGDTLDTSIELALQTGDAPDIFCGGSAVKHIESGYIMPIDDLPGGEDILKYYKDNNMLKDQITTWDGKTYRIPSGVGTRALVYNKDLFKAAGIVDEKGEAKPPVTLDELIEYAKKLTDPSKKQYGFIMPLKWSAYVSSDFIGISQPSVGHSGYDYSTGKYCYVDMAPVLDKLVELYNSGSVYPGAESIDNDTARAYFSAGKIGMKTAYSFDVSVYNNQFPAECDWGVAPLPVLDKDNVYAQEMTPSYSLYINKASADKADKIAKVYKYLYSDEFISELYVSGSTIPAKKEIINSVEFGSDAPKGWKEFGEMANISIALPRRPQVDSTNTLDLSSLFMDRLYSNAKTSAQILKEYDESVEAGRKLYYDLNGGYKASDFVNPEWTARR